ncbi:beta strand repeat-containing protein [Oryzomonas rubra]|uniref:Big-1 domain-containing protein n=1 Tax=Oryzomonas rubra TaxID=2509454 RepID=A0A5A9XFC8_9BACT|nr:Ig-like domain-containing protein [Oryzomonas rubra]KAA0891333.1 hypothetical protein ET418_11150 [Oryzomonas rubra]
MKKWLLGILLATLSLGLFGCGSGDFGASTTSVSGMASKGPINGAHVAIFSVTTSGRIDKQLATGTTASSGAFSADLGAYTGAIFATMSGSTATYTDEATNTAKTLGTQKLHAATVVTGSGPINLAITPFTEVAYRKAASLRKADIAKADALVSNVYLSGTDVIKTLPANVLSGGGAASSSPSQISYGLALATVSQLLKDQSGATLESVITQMQNAITGSDPTTATLDTTFKSGVYATAISEVRTNANLQSGIVDTPLNITLAASPTSVVANNTDTITLTATVTKFGGVVVPNTAVKFAVRSGTATLSSAQGTTDSTGKATITVKSGTIQSAVVITASVAATSSTDLTTSTNVAFVQDPNDPASVSLTASKVAATANGIDSITLTAKVTRVGTGPVPTGTTVTFAVAAGTATLSATTGTTDSNGNASVTLTSTTVGSVTVSASAATSTGGKVTGATNVEFQTDPNAPASVTLSASPTTAAANNTPITITATVAKTGGGAVADGTPVTFAVTSGTASLSATSATTVSGTASVALTSTTVGSVTVTATVAGPKTGTSTVSFTTPPAQPTIATVKLATTGTLPSGTTIGGIDATVTYSTNKGLTYSSTVVSGVGGSSFLTPNGTVNGQVALSLINTSGIQTGEFATVTFNIASGNTPTASDFTLSSSAVTDTVAAPISGISVRILSVSIQ